jgi:hypothetical protein
MGQKLTLGESPWREAVISLKSPGSSYREVLLQRRKHEGNSRSWAGNQAQPICSRRLCQPFPAYDATCANPLQSKAMPWPCRAGASAMPCSMASGCSI